MPALAIAENALDIVQMMVLGVGRIFWVQFLFRSIPKRWVLLVHHQPALEDREGPGIPGHVGGEGCHLVDIIARCSLNAAISFSFKVSDYYYFA